MSARQRRVVILAERQYEDLELWYPKLRLEEEGVQVVVAGTGEKTYVSKHGYPVTTQAKIGDLRADDFDGVVVPGGWAPDYLRRFEDVKRFVRATFEAGKLVAAICHGGSVLVSAGVLQGRTVTSVTAIRDDLTNAGAEWVDAEVIVDRNLVTSRRPDDLPAFMKAVITVLQLRGRPQPAERAAVEGELVTVRLERASFDYMLDMLGRLPSARDYHGETLETSPKDPAAILSDFAHATDPKGTLEAESPVVVELLPQDGGYVARGNERLYEVLSRGEVPGVGLVRS